MLKRKDSKRIEDDFKGMRRWGHWEDGYEENLWCLHSYRTNTYILCFMILWLTWFNAILCSFYILVLYSITMEIYCVCAFYPRIWGHYPNCCLLHNIDTGKIYVARWDSPDASDSKAGPLPPALIGKLVYSASELVRIRLIGGHFCHTIWYALHCQQRSI